MQVTVKNDIAAGQEYGGYQLERPLGSGGMADVWLGQADNGALAAVKLLRASSGDTVRELFVREQRAVLRLQHPHLIPVFDVGDDYIVTAYVEGADLSHRLRSPISVLEAVEITCAIAAALSYAHTQGIVHCDVKPSNILLDKNGNAFLADFGIARFASEVSPANSKQAMGTPAFMAPEQKQGLPGPKADQYSLAKTLLVTLGGSLKIPVAQAVGAIPQYAGLDQVLLRALSEVPDKRFADLEEFRQALIGVGVQDETAATRLAPLLRDTTPFAWASVYSSLSQCGEHIWRADYRISELVEHGVLTRSKADEFSQATGCVDFGWSLYARDEKLGPIDAPSVLARAQHSTVLLHGLFSTREIWRDVAVGIARDNGMSIVLVPDLAGFGESQMGRVLPDTALSPEGSVFAMNAWLQLIGVHDTPAVIVGHSYSAVALMTVRTANLGEDAYRICLTPAFFYFQWRLRLSARVKALMAMFLQLLPLPISKRLAIFLFRRDASLSNVAIETKDAMAHSLLNFGAYRVGKLLWKLASARPAPPDELHNCVVVSTPDDPLVSKEQAQLSIQNAGLPESQWYRLVYGGHFPQMVDDEHPEWGARNLHEIISLVDGVLDKLQAHHRSKSKSSNEKSSQGPAGKAKNRNANLAPADSEAATEALPR